MRRTRARCARSSGSSMTAPGSRRSNSGRSIAIFAPDAAALATVLAEDGLAPDALGDRRHVARVILRVNDGGDYSASLLSLGAVPAKVMALGQTDLVNPLRVVAVRAAEHAAALAPGRRPRGPERVLREDDRRRLAPIRAAIRTAAIAGPRRARRGWSCRLPRPSTSRCCCGCGGRRHGRTATRRPRSRSR